MPVLLRCAKWHHREKWRHHVLHNHRNEPGMMTVNDNVFSENGVNIAAQHLQSNQQIGYVEIDVDAEHSDVALEIRSALEGTLRCRIPY